MDLLDKNKEKHLCQDAVYLVKAFYDADKFSWQMSGKKEYDSISHTTQKQKWLAISDLNEFFTNFKTKYVSSSIGFSKFCQLRLKWCVFAVSSGTQSV